MSQGDTKCRKAEETFCGIQGCPSGSLLVCKKFRVALILVDDFTANRAKKVAFPPQTEVALGTKIATLNHYKNTLRSGVRFGSKNICHSPWGAHEFGDSLWPLKEPGFLGF